MIELNSIVVIFLIEALGALVLLVLGFFIFSRSKSAGEEIAAHDLIDKLEDTEKIKAKKIGAMIHDCCDINEEEFKSVLGEILQGERLLYQNIIQMFLNKDVKLLRKIDHYIDNLSEPYCKILRQSSGASSSAENTEILSTAEERVHQLMLANEKLAEQLNMSMSTIDEISAEYTRVFSGTQTELELENSSKKMMEIFRNAQNQVKTAVNKINKEAI